METILPYFLDNGRSYDTALGRLSVHESDSWKGIAPSTQGADFNPEPPIFTAKFAKCSQNEHILAIANEDGMVCTYCCGCRVKANTAFSVYELFLFKDCLAEYKP